MIKEMTPEELAEYHHQDYLKHRDKRLIYAANHYRKHKKELLNKANLRYKEKCNLKYEEIQKNLG